MKILKFYLIINFSKHGPKLMDQNAFEFKVFYFVSQLCV